MSSPFSHTLRSLHADSFRASAIGMIAALVLLSAWFAWFFMARIPSYRVSLKAYTTQAETVTAIFPDDGTRVRETREQRVIAEFLPEAAEDIRPGQSALLYLDGEIGKQTGSVPATVNKVNRSPQKAQILLSALSDAGSPLHIPAKTTGQVKIMVSSLSPAELVMRTAGFFADLPGVHPGKRISGNKIK